LIADIAVDKQFRNLGIHKELQRMAVKQAINLQLPTIWAISLISSWRKPEKKYRFNVICKAKWHNEDSLVVKRDLQLEENYSIYFHK
jgi:hypothetical protein